LICLTTTLLVSFTGQWVLLATRTGENQLMIDVYLALLENERRNKNRCVNWKKEEKGSYSELKGYDSEQDEEKGPRSCTDKDYDPNAFCNADHPTSYFETLVHLFKGTVGTGILALPSAFAQSGYIGGIIGVIILVAITNYSAHLIAKCQYELCRRRKLPELSFQGTIAASFQDGPECLKPLASLSIHICNCLMILGLVGSTSVYISFISDNVKVVADPIVGERHVREYMLWLTIPLLIVNMVRSLKRLAPFSTVGNFVLVVSAAVVMYYDLTDTPSIRDRNMFGSFKDIPDFVGTVYFAAGCISLIIPLRNEMKKPELFTSTCGVLNCGAFIVGALYAIFGFLGYLKYGEDAQGSVTLNLPHGELLPKLVQGFLSLSTLLSTSLQTYVVSNIILEDYLHEKFEKKKTLIDYVFRIFLILLTVAITMAVPVFKVLVSLIGVLGHCTLATFLPCFATILVFHEKRTFFKFIGRFYLEIMIIIFTLIILVTGIISNVRSIMHIYGG